jgi:hypothetical protein
MFGLSDYDRRVKMLDGMCSTLKDQINAQLLAFFKGAAAVAA